MLATSEATLNKQDFGEHYEDAEKKLNEFAERESSLVRLLGYHSSL